MLCYGSPPSPRSCAMKEGACSGVSYCHNYRAAGRLEGLLHRFIKSRVAVRGKGPSVAACAIVNCALLIKCLHRNYNVNKAILQFLFSTTWSHQKYVLAKYIQIWKESKRSNGTSRLGSKSTSNRSYVLVTLFVQGGVRQVFKRRREEITWQLYV